MDVVFKRVSVREFLDKEVENGKIELLLKAAMASPSAGNQQPWEFIVIRDSNTLKEMAGCSSYAKCLKNAPLAIVLCERKIGLRFPEFSIIDMGIAAENILIEAVEIGLGAVLLGIAPLGERIAMLNKLLNLPHRLSAFAIIACGYPITERSQQDRYDGSRVHYEKL